MKKIIGYSILSLMIIGLSSVLWAAAGWLPVVAIWLMATVFLALLLLADHLIS